MNYLLEPAESNSTCTILDDPIHVKIYKDPDLTLLKLTEAHEASETTAV